tara:strand:- start:194 stop:1006 length:813 start_codon:yes stop_codon:yes gene_type:complete
MTVASSSTFPTISSPLYAYVSLISSTGIEVVKVTDITGNVFTIVRAQDNTTAAAFTSSDRVELRVTAAMIEDIRPDATNVAAAGALMDSELTTIAAIKALDQGVATGDSPQFTGITATADSTFSSVGALQISKGSTAQRPTGATGMLRYNSTTTQFEGYSGSSAAWNSVGGSAISNDTSTSSNLYPLSAAATSGTAAQVYTSDAKYLYKPSDGSLQAPEMISTNGLVVNSATVSTSYTIPTGSNAMSIGTMTVGSGATVTVSSGSKWVVI